MKESSLDHLVKSLHIKIDFLLLQISLFTIGTIQVLRQRVWGDEGQNGEKVFLRYISGK